MERRSRHDGIPDEHLLDCVWRMDLDLRITDVNPAAEAMLGIPAEVLVGSSLADHTTPADFAQLRELLTAALAASDRTAGLVHETRIKHADGHLVPLEVHSRLLLDADGQPCELLGVARDISGRRERERRDRQREQSRLEDQKLDALARLAAGVVQAIEPLLAGSPKHDAPAPREPASAFLADLRALARVQPLRRDDLDVDDLLTRILTDLRGTLPAGVELVPRPGAGGSTVWADGEQLTRVLRDLVRRAADSLGDGGRITVASGLSRHADPAEDAGLAPPPAWITIEVRDDGPGFDHATRERIFEPYRGGDPTVGDLGLAVAHGIVVQHGGRLEAESRRGQGSVFRVLLPARFADEILAAPLEDESRTAGATVLLVEDDPDIRGYCERVLRSGGYRVISCADGVEALAVVTGGEHLDAVVLDWGLPGLDGRRVLEQVSRRHPELPSLVISGHDSKDFRALGVVTGDTPWLAKPFTPPALLGALRALLPSPGAPGS